MGWSVSRVGRLVSWQFLSFTFHFRFSQAGRRFVSFPVYRIFCILLGQYPLQTVRSTVRFLPNSYGVEISIVLGQFFFGFVLTIYWRIVCFVSIRLYLPILFVLFLVVVVVFKEIS